MSTESKKLHTKRPSDIGSESQSKRAFDDVSVVFEEPYKRLVQEVADCQNRLKSIGIDIRGMESNEKIDLEELYKLKTMLHDLDFSKSTAWKLFVDQTRDIYVMCLLRDIDIFTSSYNDYTSSSSNSDDDVNFAGAADA